MGKASRDKGARGENEVCKLAKAHGFPSARTRSGGGQVLLDVAGVPGFAIESRRRERLNVAQAYREAQAELDEAGSADSAILAHRRNNEPWLATLELDELLAILKAAQS